MPGGKRQFGFGPGILVTAAFIGPGTVMAASSAGMGFGNVLLWAVGFSVLATIVLQEIAARIGFATGGGLSRAIGQTVQNRALRILFLGLVLVAIFIGNSAYQTGNILGAASGVSVLIDNAEPSEGSKSSMSMWVSLIGIAALILIWIGRFEVLQLTLMGLVALFSMIFVMAAIRSEPDWADVLAGFIPRIPKGSEWIVIGLIGTTVVPYNLFLHSSATAERLAKLGAQEEIDLDRALWVARWDTILSVLLGGLVTAAVLVTASVAFASVEDKSSLGSVSSVAKQLEPALGSWARIMFAIGLFSAGLTSAITAPVAAAYAASGCFGWSGKLSDVRLKMAATLVIATGIVFAIAFGKSPRETIILAQAANGLLLPIIVVFLLVLANRKKIMGQFVNGWLANALGIIVTLIVSLIAFKNLSSVFASLKDLFSL